MDKSTVFLQKHPSQMLLWQFRVVSAISLNNPMAGYEAGQKLLAAGAADSNDPNLQRLLAQLNNKGWLDKKVVEDAEKQAEEAAKQEKYDGEFGNSCQSAKRILGTWSAHYSWDDERGGGHGSFHGSMNFEQTSRVIEGHFTPARFENVEKPKTPSLTATILDSGKLNWNETSCEISDDSRTMKIVFSAPNGDKGTQTSTWLLHKE
jgi:hypothetical protein